MTLRFGVVGCGMIAGFHAKALADCTNAELVACFSRSAEGTQAFADKYKLRPFTDLQAMIDGGGIDAVTICSPSGAHLDPALAAAKAGKHVVVEKPLEITTERCDQIIHATEAAGVKLGVTFQSRFHHASQLLKQAMTDGRFGTVTMGDAHVKWFRSQQYYDGGSWRGTWQLDGGGALMNQTIHSVDLLLWLMGDVVDVQARTATMTHQRIEVEDVAVATLQFCSGALGVIEATTTAYPGSLKRIEICGSGGMAILEEENIKQWQFLNELPGDAQVREHFSAMTKTGGGVSDPAAIGHHGHAQFFDDFVNAVKQDREPAINGIEGRKSVEVIEAIYRSARERRTIPLA